MFEILHHKWNTLSTKTKSEKNSNQGRKKIFLLGAEEN